MGDDAGIRNPERTHSGVAATGYPCHYTGVIILGMRCGGGYTWHTRDRYQYGSWRGNLQRRRRSLLAIPIKSPTLTPHE
ncbi:unnamed protein product [Calypogeia fissa]